MQDHSENNASSARPNWERGLILLYSGPISKHGFGKLIEQVIIAGIEDVRQPATVILTTYGGDGNAAYRIARFMQDMFSPFTVCVCGPCKSAGTLIATGAHKLIIFPHCGELGPLDVQMHKRDEIGEMKSGLSTKAAFDSLSERAFDFFERFMIEIKTRSSGLVRFKTATDVASRVVYNLLGTVYAQIDPELIGEEHRDMQVALEYARRLSRNGCNISIEGIRRLTYNYPSHGFVIDYQEAQDIFNDVGLPDEALRRLVGELGVNGAWPTEEPFVKILANSTLVKEDVEFGDQGQNDEAGQKGRAAQ